MTKAFLALGAAAVALSATPAMADRHDNHGNRHRARTCAKWRHHHCVRWANHGYRVSSARHAMWRTALRFSPTRCISPLWPRQSVPLSALNRPEA